jgi:hypothetical protein
MPRQKVGLESTRSLRSGRRAKKGVQESATYASGWLAVDGPPEGEDLVRLGGSVYSILFLAADTRNVYKQLKKTDEWFRFAFIVADEM